MNKITGQQMLEAYSTGSNQDQFNWDAIGDRLRGAFTACAELANKQHPTQAQQVPRIIHEAFWRKFYQWADGLEAVLKSEQVDAPEIRLRLDKEYADACTRLTATLYEYEGTKLLEDALALKGDSLSRFIDEAAIPPKRM